MFLALAAFVYLATTFPYVQQEVLDMLAKLFSQETSDAAAAATGGGGGSAGARGGNGFDDDEEELLKAASDFTVGAEALPLVNPCDALESPEGPRAPSTSAPRDSERTTIGWADTSTVGGWSLGSGSGSSLEGNKGYIPVGSTSSL